ncbi:50S ribosomal protein L11 methyltransferase [Clostridium sp.]|uniref:50S ribosomal protein L11 methyltransferase n=1 Tax=Clostridium sp. TaxID=1506 RepID=UPI001DAF8775|nr:50S ribosomal protein L11 methyltransferase [Clostridium sp.]MBS5986183.1 50S ribosomal protein L11 methyltransferase [Clostridium sp.]
MFIICYNMPLNKVDEKIEVLQINEIYNAFYESPLEITTDENGYGYIEKENELTTLKVAFDGAKEDLESFKNNVSNLINETPVNVYEENYDYDDFSLPAIDIDENWVLASPDEEIEGKNKINFISQGAFGTGLHETTQDLLRVILSKDFSNKRVLDIGTGSGILSIATAIKGASEVVALDIRDVQDEVELNASLNNLNNIKVFVGDALCNEVNIEGQFDWIYINIGGEETHMFMDFIKSHLKDNGTLLVSGLVEWSFDNIKSMVESNGFNMIEKHQSNEWVTAIFN